MENNNRLIFICLIKALSILATLSGFAFLLSDLLFGDIVIFRLIMWSIEMTIGSFVYFYIDANDAEEE
ncbi:hypothetical protein HKO22_03195 [Peptoniphilus sp. AGMB00490]|uniref:Uncharacterized protein n=1 Tax=Peptoniphilus faecalis TaxID=2731255 RepID=A0A848RD41_9FIRM|nr:hypothetical protein [Peptoniphilus faecalis]NMW84750.1 hypothetical protein [Peptoniphilus faecalis]